MSERCLLTSLPSGVSFDVLHEWLNLKSLTVFDSACCNWAIRRELHHVIRPEDLTLYQKILVTDYTTSYSRRLKCSSSSDRVIYINWDILQQREQFPAVMEYVRKYGSLVRTVFFHDVKTSQSSEVANAVLESCCGLTNVAFHLSSSMILHRVLKGNRSIEALSICNQRENDLEEGCSFSAFTLPKLRTLRCRSMADISDCARAGNCINRLDINGSRLKAADYAQLPKLMPGLRALCISATAVNDEEIGAITRGCPGIMHLDLFGCAVVTDLGIESVVKNLKNLQSLCIDGCTSLQLQSLVHIYTHAADTLRVLHMTSMQPGPTLADVHYHHSLLDKLFERCQNIRTLSWNDNDPDDFIYPLPSSIRNVTTLILGHGAIGDENMETIGDHCPNITNLSLRLADTVEYSRYTNVGLKKLVFGCPRLRLVEISIAGTENVFPHPFVDLATDLWRYIRPDLMINDTDTVDPCFVFDALALPIY